MVIPLQAIAIVVYSTINGKMVKMSRLIVVGVENERAAPGWTPDDFGKKDSLMV
jgi:hypothetical protein